MQVRNPYKSNPYTQETNSLTWDIFLIIDTEGTHVHKKMISIKDTIASKREFIGRDCGDKVSFTERSKKNGSTLLKVVRMLEQ